MFSGSAVPFDSKETKFGSSVQKSSSSASKNTDVILVPRLTWKYVSTAIFDGVDIPEVLGCHLLRPFLFILLF